MLTWILFVLTTGSGICLGFFIGAGWQKQNLLNDKPLISNHEEKLQLLTNELASKSILKDEVDKLVYLYGVGEVNSMAAKLKCGVLTAAGYPKGEISPESFPPELH